VSESRASFELLVSLVPGAEPLRHQLARRIAEAVRDGRLRPGTRLPASRDLAAQLGVSRGVVTDAYAQLVAQGFLAVRQRQAHIVAAGGHASITDPPLPRPHAARFDFTPTAPDVTLFPRDVWRRALDKALRDVPDAALDYGDRHGSEALRQVLAERLGRVRGVVTTPQRIVIVQGFAQGLDVLCALLAARGRRCLAIEDPALDDAVSTARLAGMELVPVPVDTDGIDVAALAATGADAVLVTPAHQFPTGVIMTPDRRRALLDWARSTGALVIEDDYDAEFRHAGPPLGTLQGLAPDHVAYIGTASKVLAPALRLGWLALPPAIAPAAAEAKWWRDSGSPMIDQLALADILASGAFDRSLRRALRSYRARRDRLVNELTRRLPTARISGAAAGLHLVLELQGTTEATVVARALERGINVRGLSSYAVDPARPARTTAALVLGYGRLPEPAIADAVARLAATAAAG
jgi:GntR family transcriptional regulator/MocR family aminotransferase